MHIVEARKGEAQSASFGAARKHNVGISVLYRAKSLTHRMGAAGASGYGTVINPLESRLYGNSSRRHIAYHHRDGKNTYSSVALIMISGDLLVGGMKSAYYASDNDSAAVRIQILKIASAVLKCLFCRIYRILGHYVNASSFFFFNIVAGIEILNIGVHVFFLALTGKPFGKGKAVPSVYYIVPEFVYCISDGAYHT